MSMPSVESVDTQTAKNILVVGLGNELLQDDGVGVHLARELSTRDLPGVRVIDIGTAVIQILDDLEWADYVIGLDAMNAGGQPGDVYLVDRDDVQERTTGASMHDLDLLSVLRFCDRKQPPKVQILGVEPLTIDYGLHLTEPVKSALPQSLSIVEEVIHRWQYPGLY